MKKLFSGRIGRIPMAVLAISLLAVIAAGGVVAATTGYVLWEGVADITVDEAILIRYASESEYITEPEVYPHMLVLGADDPLGASIGMYPGMCGSTYFKITSATSADLLIKVVSSVTGDAPVTVTYDVADLDTVGAVVNSATPLYIVRTICVDGAADPDDYTVVATGFTRESPPPLAP